MIAPRTAGLSRYQSSASSLLTEMKSEPRNTPTTPGTPKRRCARGERSQSSALVKLAEPTGMTARPGRNLSEAGLGVCSVSMNMVVSGIPPVSLGQGGAVSTLTLHSPSDPGHSAAAMGDRRNNFDALRLGAALSVVLTHAFLLGEGRIDIDPLMWLAGGP